MSWNVGCDFRMWRYGIWGNVMTWLTWPSRFSWDIVVKIKWSILTTWDNKSWPEGTSYAFQQPLTDPDDFQTFKRRPAVRTLRDWHALASVDEKFGHRFGRLCSGACGLVACCISPKTSLEYPRIWTQLIHFRYSKQSAINSPQELVECPGFQVNSSK